jgi:hypothetical protein
MERTPSWLRPGDLEPLWRLNEQALELFVDVARLPDGSHAPIALTPALREAFRRVDAGARHHLARRPRLLVDLAFDDLAAWQSSGNPRRARPPRPAPLDDRVLRIAHAATTLAWHLTRVNRDAAIILLDVSVPLTDQFLRLELTQLREAADRLAGRLAPRWADRPHLWRHWLSGAGAGPDRERDHTIHALQLGRVDSR